MMLREILRGAEESGAHCEEIISDEIKLAHCKGCLRCNLLKRCAIKGDDWDTLSKKILEANTLVFASPVYFHHLTSPLKKIVDRFRSFIHVQLTESGLVHTPHHRWNKHFILLLSLGSSDEEDARPIIELFTFITSILGNDNRLTCITGNRLVVAGQVTMTEERLATLYPKLGLPAHLSKHDYPRNQRLLQSCYETGKQSGLE